MKLYLYKETEISSHGRVRSGNHSDQKEKQAYFQS
jgi:hypothetical protein